MAPNASRNSSPDACRDEGDYQWIEQDPYTKWDEDWQGQYKEPDPTPVQAAVSTARNTWKNLTVSSIKGGLYSAASVAADKVAKEAKTAATKLAETGSGYVNQNILGKQPARKHYDYYTEEDAYPPYQYKPPINAFTYEPQDGRGRSLSPQPCSNRAAVREYRRDRARGINNAQKPDVRERLIMKEDAEEAERFREATRKAEAETKAANSSKRQDQVREREVAKVDEAEVYYDPLGLDDEWHCPAAKCEQEKERRERMWAEWRAKPERESRRQHQRPELWIGGRPVETKSTARRTDHGVKEDYSDEEKDKATWRQAPVDGML